MGVQGHELSHETGWERRVPKTAVGCPYSAPYLHAVLHNWQVLQGSMDGSMAQALADAFEGR